MNLLPAAWAMSGGHGESWGLVLREFSEASRRRLTAARTAWRRRGPRGFDFDLAATFSLLLAKPDAALNRLLTEPAMDYWLHLCEKHFGADAPPDHWRIHMGLLQGFAAELARRRGAGLTLRAPLDPKGRFHMHGGPLSFDFGEAAAGRIVEVRVQGGAVTVAPDAKSTLKAPTRFGAENILAVRSALGIIHRAPEVAPGIYVEQNSWLINHGVIMHGLGTLAERDLLRFAAVIRDGLRISAAIEPALASEISDVLRLLIPLATPATMSSVSSSYTTMRGAIALSHSDSALLQIETLVHEFCHQKLNLLSVVEPLIEAGQSSQVFFSPWRPDARRLRGVLIGAHAFLNVARHLHRMLATRTLRDSADVDAMRNISLRVAQSDYALRSVARYADLTPFGEKFHFALMRECSELSAAILAYPEGIRLEALATLNEHRAKHELGETGLHRRPDFVDRLPRAPFNATPGARSRR